MQIEELEHDALWRYYQRGYHCLIRSGLYFRQILRPALSHVYFQRAVPLFVKYAQANHGSGDLPAGFSEQLSACPLSPRDLLHLDYAICLGYAEAQGHRSVAPTALPVMAWPGFGGVNGVFIAADAHLLSEITSPIVSASDEDPFDDMDDDLLDPDDDDDSKPPFDL